MFCGRVFYRKLTAQSSMSSTYRCCFSLFQIWCDHSWILIYQRVFVFPPFCFNDIFIFLFQSKTKITVKDINQYFTSSKLNKEKSEHSFVKNLICDWCFKWFLLKCLREVGARQSKKFSPGSPELTVFFGQIYFFIFNYSANYFFMNQYFKTKAELP